MKDLVKALEGLPQILRILLVIFYGAFGNIVRLLKSLAANNILGVVLSIVLLCCGGFVILWIYDLYCVIVNKPIWWFC